MTWRSSGTGRMAKATAAVVVIAAGLAAAPAAQAAPPRTGTYIVMIDEGLPVAQTIAKLSALVPSSDVVDVFRALGGFTATLTPAQAAALAKLPVVDVVEPDAIMTTTETWGLDRIDQSSLPLDDSYTPSGTGAGVTAYIIDTGIQSDHPDFGSRVKTGYSVVSDGRGTADCNGHGTHVAGTVGGTTYGVAKGVVLVPVRVLGCDGSGSTSGVIKGMDWVAKNAVKPAVANMSLGGLYSSSTNAAVKRMTDKGVTVAVAAGNDGISACWASPASAPSALTVAASTKTDGRASFSNYGSCVDLFAPGVGITSDWIGGSTNTISGTSMASPHVAGVAALILQQTPTASPATVAATMKADAVRGKISGTSGSPNLLVQVP